MRFIKTALESLLENSLVLFNMVFGLYLIHLAKPSSSDVLTHNSAALLTIGLLLLFQAGLEVREMRAIKRDEDVNRKLDSIEQKLRLRTETK